MRQIPLTQGKFALVDDEDYEYISQHKWYYDRLNGHAQRGIWQNGKMRTVRMHRTIMGVQNASKDVVIDHIDHNTLNNTKENLRICTNALNQRNKVKRPNSSSKNYKGISWVERNKKWRAHIGVDNKLKHLGYFKEEIDAALAYNRAAIEFFGEYAYLNVIPEIIEEDVPLE